MKKTFTILLAALGILTSRAQLANLEPRSMEMLTDVAPTGHKARANIEIQFDTPLEGAKIVRDNYAMPDAKKTSTPTIIYAQVNAQEQSDRYARSLTVTHPDFVPCVITFSELGMPERLEIGRTYRIHVAVPAADFVVANRAFAALDFDGATDLYERYLASGDNKYEAIARKRLELMQKMTPQNNYLRENADKNDRPTKIRKMKAAQELYEHTSSLEAYKIYRALRSELIPGKRSSDEGVSEIIVSSVTYDPVDRMAFSDRSLELKDGSPYYSWLLVDLPMDDVEFDHPLLHREAAHIDGKYRVYVAPGASETLTVTHPDCAPLEIKFADFGISEIAPASVYRVNLMAPPPALIEADRAFSALDFPSAQMLYSDMLQNYEQYGDTTLSIVSDRLATVNRLVDRDYRGTWNRLRQFFIKRPTASREELAAKADTLMQMSRELSELKVPGMERNMKFYAKRADEYRNSIFLKISAAQMTKYKEIILGSDGKPEPIKDKSLLLEFKVPGWYGKFRQKVYASPAGRFSVYLPEEVSRRLRSNPGEEVEVIVKKSSDGKEYKIQSGKNSKLKISVDRGERTIEAPIFIQESN